MREHDRRPAAQTSSTETPAAQTPATKTPSARIPPRNDHADPAPPTSAVVVVFGLIALACVAGYFLLMKLVSVSQDEDCLLAHRRDCGAIEVPSR